MDRMVLSDIPEDGARTLKGLGIRRCRGCVRCLTETPGVCSITDGFSELMPEIYSVPVLLFMVHPAEGRVPLDVLKAVERLSNVLEAYTDSGGNVPIPADSVALREVVFEVHGDIDRRAFEAEMTDNLRKGPVGDVRFEYRS